MDLQKIYTDADFSNAEIPEGQILTYLGTDESGNVVTRYKDSQGTVGTIAGNGGGSVNVTLGQVDADGNFQPLAFNGLEASNSGNPETVENYYGWNGVLPVPDKGIKVGEAAEYYKCASVDTTAKTWTGYKAVLTDGIYTFEETLTEGLTYGDGYVPTVGMVYDTEALVSVRGLYEGRDPNLVFHAPLLGASTVAETGQSMSTEGDVIYSDYLNRSCAYFNGSSKIVVEDVSKLPFGNSLHTIAGRYNFTQTSSFNFIFGYGKQYAVRAVDLVAYQSTGGAFALSLQANQWYHIATTCDGSVINLYIDGVFVETNATPPDFDNSRPELWIGSIPGLSYGSGHVADIRIYDRCMTAEEIAELSKM